MNIVLWFVALKCNVISGQAMEEHLKLCPGADSTVLRAPFSFSLALYYPSSSAKAKVKKCISALLNGSATKFSSDFFFFVHAAPGLMNIIMKSSSGQTGIKRQKHK